LSSARVTLTAADALGAAISGSAAASRSASRLIDPSRTD
jgi:hypothetical protein